MTNLQTIISTRAIFPSITAIINRELITDHTTMMQIAKHPDTTLLYIIVLGATIYTEYKYTDPIDKRYKIFDAYQSTKKTINICIITALFVFFRNIENVT